MPNHTLPKSSRPRGQHRRVPLILGGVVLASCTPEPAAKTAKPQVVVTMDLSQALQQAASLSLNDTANQLTQVPLHAALEIRSKDRSRVFYQSAIKDGDEIALDLPFGDIELRAMVLLEERPIDWKERHCTSKTQEAPSTSLNDGSSATNTSGETSTSTSTSEDGEKGGPSRLFVSTVQQTVTVDASTETLPVSFAKITNVAWRRFAARVPQSLVDTSQAATRHDGQPTRLIYADAIAGQPIFDPCTSKPFFVGIRGGLGEISLPKSDDPAFTEVNGLPFAPALPSIRTAGAFDWIMADASALKAEVETPPVVTSNGYREPRPHLATLAPGGTTSGAWTLALLAADASDADGDGVSNAEELKRNTNPLLPPATFAVTTNVATEGGRLQAQLATPLGFWDAYRNLKCRITTSTSGLSSADLDALNRFRQSQPLPLPQGTFMPATSGTSTFDCWNWVSFVGVAGTVSLEMDVHDRMGFLAGTASASPVRVPVPAVAAPSPSPTPSPTPTPQPSPTPSPAANPPTISPIGNQATNEDTPISGLAFTINDPDSSLSCFQSVTATSNNAALFPSGSLTLNGSAPNCMLHLSPAAHQSGSALITLTVSDGQLAASTSFQVNVSPVNDDPTVALVGDTSKTIAQNSSVSIVLAKGFDPDVGTSSQSLSYFVSTNPLNGSWGAWPSDATLGGTVTFTPNSGFTGSEILNYQICDNFAQSSCTSITVDLTVFATNDAPIISAVGNQSTDEDTPLSGLSISFSDVDSALSCAALSASSDNQSLVPNGNLSVAGDHPNCTLSVTPAANQNGTANITLTVTDGTLTAQNTFVLTVTPVNDTPYITSSGWPSKSLQQDTPTDILLSRGSDHDMATSGQSLIYSFYQHPVHGALSNFPSGASTGGHIRYTPSPGYSGSDSFSYKICDTHSPTACTSGQTVTLTVQPVMTWHPEAYIKASNAQSEDLFGTSVSLSGDALAVGARGEDSNQKFITASPSADESSPDSGAVYIYRRTTGPTTWSQEAYIKPSNAGSFDGFGFAVALSGDTLAVSSPLEDSSQATISNTTTIAANDGAMDAGAVYVFERISGAWQQKAYIKATNTNASDEFGTSISLSGSILAVGAQNEDANQTTITYGGSASTNNSLSDSGAAYVFQKLSGTWFQKAYIKASNAGTFDLFGSNLSVSGDTLAVAAPGESEAGGIILSGPVSTNTNTLSSSGAVYIFRGATNSWIQEAYIKASNAGADDQFGGSLQISGDTLAVGAPTEDETGNTITQGSYSNNLNTAPNSGATYVFRRSGAVWQQEAYIKAPNAEAEDLFGSALTLSGDTLAVSAPGNDDIGDVIVNGSTAPNSNGMTDSGAVYLFKRIGTNWSNESYIRPSNPGVNDRFGSSLSLSGDTLAVGVPNKAENSTQIVSGTALPINNSEWNTGSVYIFRNLSRLFDPDVLVENVTSNIITFRWGANRGPAGTQVIVAPAGTGTASPAQCQPDNVGGSVTLAPEATTYSYPGLTAGTKYGFRFCTTDGMGVSQGSMLWFSTAP
jgi:hypothetical protein